ncbi:MAG: hypothetical protein P8P26_02615 [Porticoccaceae bacterium]|nr:hypothetical protein [Porticoccaceae bacterium]
MDFLITVALSFGLIVLALLVFRYVGTPVYRVEAVNIQVLLESVLDNTATIGDWDVFIGMRIHQSPELDEIRQQCAMLAETEMTERNGRLLFSDRGRTQLSEILASLGEQTDSGAQQ